jgi:pyruvate dehydrogenase E2 component (dihydrolipoamide acetyltransferase)
VASVTEIRVPDLGDFKDVEVIDVAVKPGDTIAEEAALITLETEKATMDVPAAAGGTIREVKVKRGDRVSKGDVIALLEPAQQEAPAASAAPASNAAVAEPAAAKAPPPEAAPAPAAAAASLVERPVSGKEAPSPGQPAAAARPVIDEPGFSRAHASPSVRRFARELGADLARITGTGLKGRVTAEDVKAHVKRLLTAPAPARPGEAALPAVPRVDFAAFGPVERQPLSRIQKIAGPRLHASWVNIPHVTQFDEADITALEETRARLKDEAAARGIKLTPLAFVMRACAKALAAFPHFASSLDTGAGELVIKKYLHLGFAADTPGGLVVPVVRDADRKDVYELARELATLAEKARAGKLAAAEMQGGCFTISSLGGIGGTAFTPIINAPEVAILGVSRSTQRPVFRDGAFVPRLMLPLSLSYDHRVIDGADAVRFTNALGELLADPSGLLEAIP